MYEFPSRGRLIIILFTLAAIVVGCGGDQSTDQATSGEPSLQPLTWTPLAGNLTALPAEGDASYLSDKAMARWSTWRTNSVRYSMNGSNAISVRDYSVSPRLKYQLPAGFENLSDIEVGTTVAGTPFLIAVGSDGASPANPTGEMRVFTDTNANGRIDATDNVVVIVDDSPSAAAGSHWARVLRVGSNTYLLDSRMYRVRILTDTTGNGLPDSLQATPFLDTTQTHFLGHTVDIQEGPEGGIKLIDETARDGYSQPGEAELCVRDVDSNGVADEYHEITVGLWPSDVAPFISGKLDSDDTKVRVNGAPGALIEVWRLDSGQNPDTKLASGQIPAGATSLDLTLPATESEGTEVAVQIAGETTIGPITTVGPPRPRVTDISPIEITAATTTVTVSGDGLTSALQVRLVDPNPSIGLDPLLATTTFVSSTEITVTIPSNLSTEPGIWVLEVLEGDDVVGRAHLRVEGQ